MADVIAAIATGKSPCAIGILRLSGDGCAEVADKVVSLRSGLPLAQAPNRKLVIGIMHDAQGRVVDQVLAVYTRGPNSYTGEDTVELQCHGSPAALNAGLLALCSAGARLAGPGEFTRRAFLNGRMDLIAAEAVIDLIDAETADAAANAAAQIGGALTRRIEPIYGDLVGLCSHYHAVLDYPDEDIPDFHLASFVQMLQADRAQLAALYATCERGRLLRSGIAVVLLGKPNVGKSSLLNALAGYDRVIVTDIPGTTRDVVEERLCLGGLPVRLIDTAGIRPTGDPVETMGVQRAEQAAQNADLALFLCDGAQPLSPEDLRAIDAAKLAKHAVGVINKSDLPQKVSADDLPFDAVFSVSALHAEGLDALGSYVQTLFADGVPCDGGILTNPRQQDAVRRAGEAIDRALDAIRQGITPDAVLTEIEAAMQALGELTGRSVREDITQQIFERFCVGK